MYHDETKCLQFTPTMLLEFLLDLSPNQFQRGTEGDTWGGSEITIPILSLTFGSWAFSTKIYLGWTNALHCFSFLSLLKLSIAVLKKVYPTSCVLVIGGSYQTDQKEPNNQGEFSDSFIKSGHKRTNQSGSSIHIDSILK